MNMNQSGGAKNDSQLIAVTSITFDSFLESTPPSVSAEITDLWETIPTTYGSTKRLRTPQLNLHCETCSGIRVFRSADELSLPSPGQHDSKFIDYYCSNCRRSAKRYALGILVIDKGKGRVTKYGEIPNLGIPVPKNLLRIFGSDSELFLKGRKCENQGLGVAAFAYYRRVVENHKSELIDRIIDISQIINANHSTIDKLMKLREEISFIKAIEDIKPAIPDALLINGHNPLVLLHKALSVGLHDESDENCLQAAQDIRIVLVELSERIYSLKSDNKELKDAVHRLISKKQPS
jgi:hypothetical protein